MENPLVSVVIATYNSKGRIARAIESVFKQTYIQKEIIVVDDGSSDNTADILERYDPKDKKVIAIKNKKNMGFVSALRIGIGNARGKYIARLDDDDIWIDERKLQKQIDFLEKNPEYVLIGGGIVIRMDNKEIVRYLFPEKDSEIRKHLLVYNLFAHSSAVFLKNAFEKAGGYEKKFGFFADADLWLKLGKAGKMHNFQEFFVEYDDKEISSKKYSARDQQIRRRLILRIKMKWSHRKAYPNFAKALFFCLASYIYSFLPFRSELKPFLFKARTVILGTPYKYSRQL